MKKVQFHGRKKYVELLFIQKGIMKLFKSCEKIVDQNGKYVL